MSLLDEASSDRNLKRPGTLCWFEQIRLRNPELAGEIQECFDAMRDPSLLGDADPPTCASIARAVTQRGEQIVESSVTRHYRGDCRCRS